MQGVTEMSSPLSEYINSSIILDVSNSLGSTITNGRYQDNDISKYLVQCYLSRVQGSRQDSGIGYYRSGSEVMSSGNGNGSIGVDKFLYRGYCLRYTILGEGFQHGSVEDSLVFQDIAGDNVTIFLGLISSNVTSSSISLRHGRKVIDDAQIMISDGVYGSMGIDLIIYQNIGGVPITVYGSSIK